MVEEGGGRWRVEAYLLSASPVLLHEMRACKLDPGEPAVQHWPSQARYSQVRQVDPTTRKEHTAHWVVKAADCTVR